jgi:hypothetical protein
VLWLALGCGAPLLLVGSNLTLPQPYLNLNLTTTNPHHQYLLPTDVVLHRGGKQPAPLETTPIPLIFSPSYCSFPASHHLIQWPEAKNARLSLAGKHKSLSI